MAYIKVLAFLAVLAAAASAQNQLAEYYDNVNSSSLRNDDYLDAHRRKYGANIWFYDFQIEAFKENYLDRIGTIEIPKEMLLNNLIQIDALLYPMTLLSDESKNCVQKYQPLIPPMAAARSDMDACINAGKNQLSSIVSSVSSTNRTLQTYYTNTFEKEVTSCKTKFNLSASLNYTLCLANAVSVANVYTINNQKTFANQMDTAKNNANYYSKIAQECSVSVQNRTVTMISAASTHIDRCLYDIEDCSRCKGHFCENVQRMPSYLVDYKNATMSNPFYGRNESLNCLMLDIY